MKKKILFIGLLVILLFAFAGIAHADVKKLTVSEKSLTLFEDQEKEITVTAQQADGTTADVTDTCEYTSTDENIASASRGVVYANEPGKASITITYEGKKVKLSVVVKPQITGLDQNKSSLLLPAGASETVKAYAVSGSQNIDITKDCVWHSDNEDVATVNNGKITAVSKGTATITASYDPYNDSRFQPLQYSVEVVTPVKSLTASPNSLVLTVGQSVNFTITANYSDGVVEEVTNQATFKTGVKNKVSVSSGKITALSPGEVTVEAMYANKKATISISVISSIESLVIQPESVSLVTGQSKTLKAKLKSGGKYIDVTSKSDWSTSNSGVATVSEGKVTAVGDGTARISAIYGDLTANVDIAVEQEITSLTSDVKTIELTSDDPTANESQVNVSAVYTDSSQEDITDKVTWKLSNSKNVTVSKRDTGTFIKATVPGEYKVTAIYQNKSYTFTVKAMKTILYLTPSATNLSLSTGSTAKLTVYGAHSDGTQTDVTELCDYVSSDTNILTVDKDKVTPVAAGSANIIISKGSLSPLVIPTTVNTPVQSMKLYIGTKECDYRQAITGDYFNATAKVSRTDTESGAWEIVNPSWSSSNTRVATVSSSGNIRCLSTGSATIYARYQGKTASITVDVMDKYLTLSPAVKSSSTFDLTIVGTGVTVSQSTQVLAGSRELEVKTVTAPSTIVATVPDTLVPGVYNISLVNGAETVTAKKGLTVLPVLAMASANTSIDGRTIEVLMNQQVTVTNNDGFTLTILNGPAVNVSGVALKSGNDKVLVLTLDRAITKNSVVTLNYTRPGIANVKNQLNEELSTSSVTVTNAVADLLPPYFVSAATTTDGSAVDVTFSENVKYTVQSGFKLNINGAGYTAANISSFYSSSTDKKVIRILLKTPVSVGDTIKLSYTKTTGDVKDENNNLLSSFTDKTVINNTVVSGGTVPTGMIVTGVTLNLRVGDPDENKVILTGTGLNSNTANDVDFTKIEIIDPNIYSGDPVALTTGTVDSIAATEIKLTLSAADRVTFAGVSNGDTAFANLLKGWLKNADGPSNDADVFGIPCTVVK